MLVQALIFVVFPFLLVLAGAWDVASFVIPNRLQLALILTFAIYAIAADLTIAQVGAHLLSGAVGVAVGFGLFALDYVGGGDAKLFACVALWLGLGNLLEYSLTASLCGGILAIAMLAIRRIPLPPIAMNHKWIARLFDSKRGIPYGVALSAAALLLLPSADIFRQSLTS